MSEPVRQLNVCPDCRRGTCKEDMYGALPRDPPEDPDPDAFDGSAFESALHGLFLEHPIIKSSEELGGAVASRIGEAIWGDYVHPRSYLSRCLGAILASAAWSAVERIAISGLIPGHPDEVEKKLLDVLMMRLWTRACDECGAAIPIRHCWCEACRIRIESSPPPPELVQP